MQVGLRQVLKLQQSLVMTPQLKMAIKLLTLNHLELRDAVAQELLENPVLDESFEDPESNVASREKEASPAEEASEQAANKTEVKEVTLDKKDQADNTPEIDWEAYAESYSYLPPGASGGPNPAFDDLPGYDQTLTRSETLEQHLLWQVRMSDFNPLEMEIAIRLIGEMSDDGFLDSSPLISPPPLVATAANGEADGKVNGERADAASNGESTDKASGGTSEKPADLRANNGEAMLADGIGAEGLLADGPAPATSPRMDMLGDGSGEGVALVDGPAAQALSDPSSVQDASPSSVQDASSEDVLADGDGGLLADGPNAGAPTDPLMTVADDLEVPVEWVNTVRRRLMSFDPVGCLALDLRECLVHQLEIWGYDNECLAYNLVHDHMSDVENRNFQSIAKTLKVPMAELGEAMKIIENLEPRPARNYLPAEVVENQQYITPDVYLLRIAEEYVISLNEDGMPKLKVSQFYLDKLKVAERGDPSKSYIKEKMRSATWLIRSIHQRQRTIYKVVESILKFQRDWFDEKGPLRPLILKEVADDIEMHESTVSRVTSRKYLHCHRGIFELKYFFNSSIATKDGANIASESVKDEIKRIVGRENEKKPFSDAAIVKLLKERDIDIARRTVAKYREMLGILPSNKRKQVF